MPFPRDPGDAATEVRREEALLKAGALQNAILKSANFSSIATDAMGVIQIFNVGAERMLGYTAAEVVNQITPADLSDPTELIARAKSLSVELGTPITPGFDALVFKASRGIEDIYELTYCRKDKSRVPAVVSVTALRDAHEAIIGYLLIGTDNTARRQAEDALVKAGALQSAIFNSANFSSIATDAKGVIQIFNVGAERMLGYTAAEVVNRITPADISDPQEVVARAEALSVELGTPITPGFEALVFKASRRIEDIYELTYIRKDGSRFPAVVSVTALRDVQNAIIGYLLIGTDNTARRTADLVERTKTLEQQATALARTEERTNYALGAAHMGIWELDLATQEISWGETIAAVFGALQAPQPTSNEGIFELIHKDDRQMVEDAIAKAARDGADYNAEFRVVWPDGTTHWLLGQAVTVRDADDKPVRLLGVCSDIGDRKLLEAQLRQSQKMEAVGQLAGGIAHDFNNLLTAVLGYSNFVMETLGAYDPRRADMEQVITAGQRATALTKQLLAFSRKQVLQPTAVDLNALVTGMHPMLRRLIGEQVDLVPVLSPDLCTVRADPGQLEQVLMNLVVNARDAMPSGGRLAIETQGVTLDGSFMHEAAILPGAYVMLAVSDTGIGMDEDTRQRMFEPFFTTKGPGKGTGLGLATVYGIVKQSGGYVWVYSEVGKGTTFKIYLPSTDSSELAQPAGHIMKTAATGTETILVVEDEQAVRHLTRMILERAGYRVFDAPNPKQAEALFEERMNAFDLLVTDVIMPGASGPQLYERLSKKRPDLKVLYVSGYTDDAIVHQGQLDPGIEFLQKPFTADALNQRVREVLDH